MLPSRNYKEPEIILLRSLRISRYKKFSEWAQYLFPEKNEGQCLFIASAGIDPFGIIYILPGRLRDRKESRQPDARSEQQD